MDDVLGGVMVAAGDPHLVATDAVAPVIHPGRLRCGIQQRRTRMGFAETHRAEPAAVEHGREELRALRGAAEGLDDTRGGGREEDIARRRRAGRTERRHHRRSDRRRQPKPADLRRESRGDEPGIGVGTERRRERGRRDGAARDHARLRLVERRRDRREAFDGQGLGALQHRLERVPVQMAVARVGERVGRAMDLEQLESELCGEHPHP